MTQPQRRDIRMAHDADRADRIDRIEELLLLLFGSSEPGRARRNGIRYGVYGPDAGRAARMVQLADEIEKERADGS